MKINKLMLCIAVTAATIACDDNNIGKTIAEADSHLVVDSTFTITGQSVNNSKINSRQLKKLTDLFYMLFFRLSSPIQ